MQAEYIARQFDKLDFEVTKIILLHLKELGEFTATDLHRLTQLKAMGRNLQAIFAKIDDINAGIPADTYELLRKAGLTTYNKTAPIFNELNIAFESFGDNARAQRLLSAIATQTSNSLQNITGSLGFVGVNNTPQSIQQFYASTLDYAMLQINTGLFDYNTAIKQTVRTLIDSGLRYIPFASEAIRRAQTAARTAIFTGTAQLREVINRERGQAFGADGMEISYHLGFRPDHDFGGLQFSMLEYQTSIQQKLLEFNCRHRAFPIILGVSKPVHSQKQLRSLNQKETRPLVYGGETYTQYTAMQHQRDLERNIRKYKERIAKYGVFDDKSEILRNQRLLANWQAEYRKFSKAVDLPIQYTRTWVYGYNK